MTELFSSADMTLAKRIEKGHAHSGRSFAMAQGDTAAVEEIAGGFAVFTGLGAPSTQALNIGLNEAVSREDFERLQEFYRSRKSPLIIDYCALADQSLFELIQGRPHAVREITFVLARKVTAEDRTVEPPADIEIARVEPAERPEWAKLTIQGFSGEADVPPDQMAALLAYPASVRAFFGLYQGRRLATSMMEAEEQLATFFGDATIKDGRGHGLQLAHIRRNLAEAAELGCDLASASVMPGGTSHRNYLRAGFQLVYPRIMFSIDT